jgi:hypothetical protein
MQAEHPSPFTGEDTPTVNSTKRGYARQAHKEQHFFIRINRWDGLSASKSTSSYSNHTEMDFTARFEKCSLSPP